ncbi:PREDICTED: uncharacterized protein LOC109222513 [Nicotiana attenuata]|uniref:uncharacterized protein LOC109222513 n=1 Tax=Nicotiana attenuata TaxID=49451 RepID=UPI00090542B6|nr:PREDICTED: uncharacterized protein LOC109222513 [Nicotiana attenuata]
MGLSGAKPASTPLEVNSKLTTMEYDQANGITGDPLLQNAGAYQRLVGRLLYVTITRPDINYAVQALGQFMQSPKRSHWDAALRVAACLYTRRPVTGYVIKFGDSMISWKSKKQQTVSRSSAEAEYRSMVANIAEILPPLEFLVELFMPESNSSVPASGSSVPEIVTIDHNHPLSMGPSDNPSSLTIPVKLTGSENYGLWSRSMRIALLGKKKLGFINGRCSRNAYEEELLEQWETCNAIVLS